MDNILQRREVVNRSMKDYYLDGKNQIAFIPDWLIGDELTTYIPDWLIGYQIY